MSKMRGEHALSTLAFLLMLAAYTALVVATVLVLAPSLRGAAPLRVRLRGEVLVGAVLEEAVLVDQLRELYRSRQTSFQPYFIYVRYVCVW